MKIIQKPSPNFDDRKNVKPSIILLHYTGMKTAKEALERLTDQAAKVSAHYTIDEAGEIYSHVAEEHRAWHAGLSYWRGDTDINAHSIGIEIVNKGHEHGYEEFTDKQIEAVITLCKDIQTRHEIKDVLGHSDVAPSRKQDPGELFPWEYLAQNGVGLWPSDSYQDCDSDVLNVLKNIGYDISDKQKVLIAFQRHFVPEVFKSNSEGAICKLTKSRAHGVMALMLA